MYLFFQKVGLCIL